MRNIFYSTILMLFAATLWAEAIDTKAVVSVDNESVTLSSSATTEPDTMVVFADEPNAPFGAPHRAPMHALLVAANSCPVDSAVGRDQDSAYVSKAEYEYDEDGRTIRQSNYRWVEGVKKGFNQTMTSYDLAGRVTSTSTWVWNDVTADWKGNNRTDYTYDTAGKTTSTYTYTWGNNDWVGTTRYDYSFDANGNTVESVYSTWSTTDSAWVGSNRYVYAFNANNKKTLEEYYGSYTNNEWIGSSRKVWGFDAAGNTILEETYGAQVNGIWTPKTQKNYVYDSDKNRIFYEYYSSYTNGRWIGNTKEECTYNAAKKCTLKITYAWVKNDTTWIFNKKEVNEYDTNNNQTEAAKYTWTNNDWAGNSRTTYAYNANNLKTDEITYTWVAPAWENATKKTYSYNAANKVTDQATYIWSNSAWVGQTRTATTYNAAGLQTSVSTYTWVDPDWELNSTFESFYDSKNQLYYTQNSHWEHSDWVTVPQDTIEFAYNEAGKLILQISYIWENGAWKGVSKSEYTYNAAGKQTYIAQSSWENGDWQVTSYTETIYDDNNRVTLEQRYTWENSYWRGAYKNEYAYDSDGKTTMSAQYSWKGSDWRGITRDDYVYDNQGNILQATSYTWINAAWVESSRNVYTYDANNRVLERVISNMIDSSWVNQTKYTYTYDNSGNTIISDVFNWSDEQWMPSSISEKTYDEDSAAKLRTELTATYNNSGIVQSYSLVTYYYACDIEYFTITFKNWNDTVLLSTTLAEGSTPAYTDTPTKPAGDHCTFTFHGWDNEIVPATEDMTYTALFDTVWNKYLVVFMNGTEVLQQDSVMYGVVPTYNGATPEQEEDEYYTYTFQGWFEGTPQAVSRDITYHAAFFGTERLYEVVFMNYDSTLLQTDSLVYGALPAYTGATPTREEDEGYTYTFSDWSPVVETVTGEAAYIAQYEAVPKVHTGWQNTNTENNPIRYNVLGNQVGEDYHGIVIINGKKYIQ